MEGMGYVYIMTNPDWPDLVKIGYADDVNRRLAQLNTAVPRPYSVYATYEVQRRLSDTQVHRMIEAIHPGLRIRRESGAPTEFFKMNARRAWQFFEALAQLSGTQGRLRLAANPNPPGGRGRRHVSPGTSLAALGIAPGEKLQYKGDPEVECTVCGDRTVSYQGEEYSMTRLAKKLRRELAGVDRPSLQGTLWFLYQGRTIAEWWQEYCREHPANS